LAVKKYFKLFEKEVPDFVTRSWIGDIFVGEAKFEGRSKETKEIAISMAYLTNQCNFIY
jgi:hypothetical protein